MDDDEYYYLKPIEPKNKPMNLGTLTLGLVWVFFIVFGFIGGFSDIWYFGVLLAVITIVLAIRNYKLKKK